MASLSRLWQRNRAAALPAYDALRERSARVCAYGLTLVRARNSFSS